MAGGSSPPRASRTSPVLGAKSAPQPAENNEATCRRMSKMEIYLPSMEQGGHVAALDPKGAFAKFDQGDSASPKSFPKHIIGGTAEIAVVESSRASRASATPKMDSESKTISTGALTTPQTTPPTTPTKVEVGRPADRIVRRRPAKLQRRPIATWTEEMSSKRKAEKEGLSLRSRRPSMPALIIDCGSTTTTPATTDHTPSCPKAELNRESFFDKYSMLPDVLGRGSMGVVRRAVRLTDGKQVAVKIMSSDDPEVTLVAQQEYDLLRTINHPFIVQAIDIFFTPTCTELVLEHLEGKNLEDAVKLSLNGYLLEHQAEILFVKLLHALAHLHAMLIIHRDVKPQNMLVSADLQDLHLLDFNSARMQEPCDAFALSPTGTCMYAAPEVVRGCAPVAGSDVWSAGLCCHLMLVGRLPQRRSRGASLTTFKKDAATRDVSLTSSKWQHISEPFKTALRRCLSLDHIIRPSAKELLAEECFSAARDLVSACLREHSCASTLSSI